MYQIQDSSKSKKLIKKLGPAVFVLVFVFCALFWSVFGSVFVAKHNASWEAWTDGSNFSNGLYKSFQRIGTVMDGVAFAKINYFYS